MQLASLRPGAEPITVVIETPRGSRHKYAFDKTLQMLRLKKTMPLGTVFPFDFGFIPNTEGGDGDPLDILVLMDEPAFAGCAVECRIVGAIKARQTDKKGKQTRNDRIVGISTSSILYKNVTKLQALSKDLTVQIENYFKDYNRHEGKEFTPIGYVGKKQAMKLIKESTVDEGA